MALLLAVAALSLLELAGRSRGMTPHYQDTPRHWAYWRGQANGDPKVVALLGSSRTQLGVNPDEVAKELGRPVVNLAMNGGTPFPVLAQLADDQDFVGTAFVEGYPSAMFADDKALQRSARSWLGFYSGRSRIDDIEARMRAALQSALVSARPAFRPTLFAVTLLVHRRLPEEGYTQMHFNRWVSADYDQPHPSNDNWTIDPKSLLPPTKVDERIAAISASVQAIEARGGKVIFFRMPSSGHVRKTEQQRLPRKKFWDDFATRVGAPALHFEDFESMRDIECGDGGHLDTRDVPKFSRDLATVLREEGGL